MSKKRGQKKKGKSTSDPEAPKNLEANAKAYFKNAETFRKKRQQRSMAQAYEKALKLGRASGTPDGLAIASEASLYLGHRAKTRSAWGIALEMYRESVELGRKSGTQDGFYAAIRAAWNLGNTLEEAGMEGFEAAFSDAIELGHASKMPEALEAASKAAFNLAQNVEPDEGVQALRDAIDLARASGTSDGTHVATRATYYLASYLLGEDKVDEAVQLFSEITTREQWRTVLELLSELFSDGDVAVRSRIPKCLEGLGEFPDEHKEAATELLQKLAKDPDESVQKAASDYL